MATNYAVLSDFHTFSIRIFEDIIRKLKGIGTDALVLNGDISGKPKEGIDMPYLKFVLDTCGESGLETFVVQGCSDGNQEFLKRVDESAKEYKNIQNTARRPVILRGDHSLLFVPYFIDGKVALPAEGDAEALRELFRQGTYSPETAVVFSHVPPRFSGPLSVDGNYYGTIKETFRIEAQHRAQPEGGNEPTPETTLVTFPSGSGVPYSISRILKEQGAPIELVEENLGMDSLNGILKECGIKKVISGHAHHSAGNAHDLNGNPVREGLMTDELFYNASCLQRKMAGLVRIDGQNMGYWNISFSGRAGN